MGVSLRSHFKKYSNSEWAVCGNESDPWTCIWKSVYLSGCVSEAVYGNEGDSEWACAWGCIWKWEWLSRRVLEAVYGDEGNWVGVSLRLYMEIRPTEWACPWGYIWKWEQFREDINRYNTCLCVHVFVKIKKCWENFHQILQQRPNSKTFLLICCWFVIQSLLGICPRLLPSLSFSVFSSPFSFFFRPCACHSETFWIITNTSMGMEGQAPAQPAANLTPRQVKTFQKMEPKALGVSASTQGPVNISSRSHTTT